MIEKEKIWIKAKTKEKWNAYCEKQKHCQHNAFLVNGYVFRFSSKKVSLIKKKKEKILCSGFIFNERGRDREMMIKDLLHRISLDVILQNFLVCLLFNNLMYRLHLLGSSSSPNR